MPGVVWLGIGAAIGAIGSQVLWGAVCALPADSHASGHLVVSRLLLTRMLLCLGEAVALAMILARAGFAAGLLALCGWWVVRMTWCLRALRRTAG